MTIYQSLKHVVVKICIDDPAVGGPGRVSPVPGRGGPVGGPDLAGGGPV